MDGSLGSHPIDNRLLKIKIMRGNVPNLRFEFLEPCRPDTTKIRRVDTGGLPE
jgi:hypothetical protein